MSAVVVRERGMPYTAPMVRAIRSGAKTQTRRIVREQGRVRCGADGVELWTGFMGWQPLAAVLDNPGMCANAASMLPYRPGDRLWVQEGYVIEACDGNTNQPRVRGRYLADDAPFTVELAAREGVLWWMRRHPFRPSPGRFMYRSLARTWLEIADVRAERVREITTHDVLAEGVDTEDVARWSGSNAWISPDNVRSYFGKLWESINGAGSWDANPWVWALGFRRVAGGAS